jgi:flagellar basal body rod protein FlgG
MDRGSYAAASGGLLQLRKLDVVNNNLANVNTAGFKKQMLAGDVQTFDQTFASLVQQQDPFAKGDHERTPATINVRTVTDFSPGPIKNTGSEFDVALRNPNDFFVVNTPGGQQYTRAGNFALNPDGDVVTADGFPVVGDGGAITVSGPGVTFAENGAVRVGREEIGKLQVVRIENPGALERVGATRFVLPAGQAQPAAVEPDLVTQSLEMSNVSAITSIIDLIGTNRGFELYTKSAQTIDTMNQTAISQVGRSRA